MPRSWLAIVLALAILVVASVAISASTTASLAIGIANLVMSAGVAYEYRRRRMHHPAGDDDRAMPAASSQHSPTGSARSPTAKRPRPHDERSGSDGRMYQVVRRHDGLRQRALEITLLASDAEAYSFTFGSRGRWRRMNVTASSAPTASMRWAACTAAAATSSTS